MKNNLISAIAGWKSAALLVLVAMVAAVAFSGVLTNGQTADAAVTGDGENTALPGTGVAGGTKVYTNEVTGELVTFTIADSSSASGQFTHSSAQNDGRTIACNDAETADAGFATACDKNGIDNRVQVELQVDADSPAGNIIINVSVVGSATQTPSDFVRVFKAPVPTRFVVTAPTKTAAAAAGTSVISISLRDENEANIVGAKINVVTTNGTLNEAKTTTSTTDSANPPVTTVTDADDVACASKDQSCTLTTGNAGAKVTLNGSNRPGTATVTFSSGELSATASIVLYGPVATISAASEQGSIEVGGNTNIVVTVLDSGDNPVAGAQVDVAAGATGVVGPERLANKVLVNNDTDKDVNGDQAVDKGDLPACGDQMSTEDAEGDDAVKGTGLRTTAGDVGAGTNLDGKCVIFVDSSATPGSATARGTHTITVNAVNPAGVALPKIGAESVEIQVGGPPSTIVSDAPPRIDPSDEVTVSLTVSDDEDVRVGKVTIEVIHTAGDGAIIADTAASTTDGRASFSYIAPSTPGVVEFLVRTKSGGAVTSQLPIIINIGAAPEEAPDAPPATWSAPLASGTHNLVWNGDDGADATDGAGEGVTAIWQWNGTGWDGYFPAAADVPGGNTLSSLTNGAAYWVVVE